MDKICYNGKFLKSEDFFISSNNRGFRYGDSFFETIKCYQGIPLFFEEHYFRIAASFCVLKLTPPDMFEMEALQSLIKNLLTENHLYHCSARIRISFFRKEGGYYCPVNNNVNFIIEASKLIENEYKATKSGLTVGLYKENILPKNTLGNIKSNNKLINVLASIYAQDQNYDDCILINEDNNIVESVSGNLFIVQNNIIKTPLLEDGCIDGVIRKILLNTNNIMITECSISISDLFNAQEVFFSNVISGLRWVSSINNNTYSNDISNQIISSLNKDYF